MKKYTLVFLLAAFILGVGFTSDFAGVVGNYYGAKEDYSTELKLYDDSTFAYTATREFPFDVSEGNWVLKGDTVILNTTPCKNPDALNHVPVRTYHTFTDAKYVVKKNSLVPVINGKLVKDEAMDKEKQE
jgi:hypothetical protein